MSGTMMHMPLTISSLMTHAAKYHSDSEIATVELDGSTHITNWHALETRAKKIASALEKLGVQSGQRVATIAMNNIRHLELYFGISGAGFVCHTINPRLFPEQLVFIVNDAEDQVLFLEVPFLPLMAKIGDKLPNLKHIVVLGPRNEEQAAMVPNLLFYDELIETGDDSYDWPQLDELHPSSLCYTSGTTGNPKGVQYTHRSTVLHSLAIITPDAISLSAQDSVLAVVPMFHVNAWGLPYAAALTGAKLVLPGFKLDGESLLQLIHEQKVSIAAGVPTIWAGLLGALAQNDKGAGTLTRTVVGGSACPPSMIKAFQDKYGVEVIHAWGMTETSPLGTANHLLRKHLELPDGEKEELRQGQGRPTYGVEICVLDEDGNEITEPDTPGALQIRGHWIVDTYFGKEETALENGWFDTGDIATISKDGFMTIRDRAKDVIKSGGEWISSVELENIAISHPEIADAAVIGVPHAQWDERPVLLFKAGENNDLEESQILSYFEDKVAKWQIPDRAISVEEIVRNATGKIPKHNLREDYKNLLID